MAVGNGGSSSRNQKLDSGIVTPVSFLLQIKAQMNL